MFNRNNNAKNKKLKTICDTALTVHCKTVIDEGSITNYLINIEDYDGGLTVLLEDRKSVV